MAAPVPMSPSSLTTVAFRVLDGDRYDAARRCCSPQWPPRGTTSSCWDYSPGLLGVGLVIAALAAAAIVGTLEWAMWAMWDRRRTRQGTTAAPAVPTRAPVEEVPQRAAAS